MKTKLSKKELLKDNLKLIEELRQAYASNVELRLLYEDMKKQVERINENIANRDYNTICNCNCRHS